MAGFDPWGSAHQRAQQNHMLRQQQQLRRQEEFRRRQEKQAGLAWAAFERQAEREEQKRLGREQEQIGTKRSGLETRSPARGQERSATGPESTPSTNGDGTDSDGFGLEQLAHRRADLTSSAGKPEQGWQGAGVIEPVRGTAQNVQRVAETLGPGLAGTPRTFQVLTFEVSVPDKQGGVDFTVPVEMRDRSIMGVLAQGHEVEIPLRWRPGITLQPVWFYNHTTKGVVSIRRSFGGSVMDLFTGRRGVGALLAAVMALLIVGGGLVFLGASILEGFEPASTSDDLPPLPKVPNEGLAPPAPAPLPAVPVPNAGARPDRQLPQADQAERRLEESRRRQADWERQLEQDRRRDQQQFQEGFNRARGEMERMQKEFENQRNPATRQQP